MGNTFPDQLRGFAKTCGMIAAKGWAEANGGNVSLRLEETAGAKIKAGKHPGPWEKLPAPFPGLAGECILLTATGCFLANVPADPEKNAGVLELDETGLRCRARWGFAGKGRPTSEWISHLGTLAVRKPASAGRERCVVHAHTPGLTTLTNVLDLDTPRLTRLIWEMNQECIILLPDGIGFAPFAITGSAEMIRFTTDNFRQRRALVWQFHGALATGTSPENALSLLEVCEKSARQYLAVLAAGGFKNKLTGEQLRRVAQAFNLSPDPEALGL